MHQRGRVAVMEGHLSIVSQHLQVGRAVILIIRSQIMRAPFVEALAGRAGWRRQHHDHMASSKYFSMARRVPETLASPTRVVLAVSAPATGCGGCCRPHFQSPGLGALPAAPSAPGDAWKKKSPGPSLRKESRGLLLAAYRFPTKPWPRWPVIS